MQPRLAITISLPAGMAAERVHDAVVGPVTSHPADAEYARLFRREFGPVTRTVTLIVRDREQAEDIAQDAFLQLLRQWPKVSTYERPDAWVRRVAIRLAMRAVRRDRLWSVIRHDVRTTPPVAPRDLDVLDAVRRLTGMQRAAVVLFYFEDRPVTEIADLLGCAEATARVHLHRGRRRLAELLGEEVDDAP